MAMNVQPIPTMSERINEIRGSTAEIVNKEILPNENLLWAWRTNSTATSHSRVRREGIKRKVRQAGLWPKPANDSGSFRI